MLNRIQAVTEGAIIPGAVLPPVGQALGEVPLEVPAAEPEVPATEPEAAANGVPVAAGVGDD